MIFKINNIVIRPPQPSQIYEFHRNCRCSDYTLSKKTVFGKVRKKTISLNLVYLKKLLFFFQVKNFFLIC